MKQKWSIPLEPLLQQFGKRKHPLEYNNRYQLVVMVILSARDTDKHINKMAPDFFKAFPDMQALAKASQEELLPYLKSVTNHKNKSSWLIEIAQKIEKDELIPVTMIELMKLRGIGRKTANVILRESGLNAEGVIVDLHVVRVAPRIGIVKGSQPEKIEKQLMEAIPDSSRWNELGMALSFLGREICRPSKPKCSECVLQQVCHFHKRLLKVAK